MSAQLLDLREAHLSSDDMPGLRAYLTQLIGEPFRFARVSYGDELTLHFGDLSPARSTRLAKHLYGAYILGFRGSIWILKSGSESLLLSSGIDLKDLPNDFAKEIGKEELEANPLIKPESCVTRVLPFVVKPANGFGLQLRVSDGSSILILPSLPDADIDEDEDLPELADWEPASPGGLLSVGSGLTWNFKPSPSSTV